MAVVVGTPYVYAGVEAAVEFVFVIGDIRSEVGGVAVCTNENIVFKLQLVDFLLSFSFPEELVRYNLDIFIPNRTLFFVG